MAKSQSTGKAAKKQKKRPGIHAKTKTSNMKNSKNWTKKYKGQGR